MTDEYAAIAAVYDLWSADMTADVPFYAAEAAVAKGPVLEIGVGTGRVALAMAETGAEVVGIDVSPAMLGRARRRVAAAGQEHRIELVEADMRGFDLGRSFALAVLPYRVFAHARTPDEQVATLEAIRRHLRPGGRVVLNVSIPHPADLSSFDGLRHEGRFRLDDTEAVLWRQVEYHPGTQQLTFHFVVDHLADDGEVVRRVHGESTMRQSTPGEIDHALARAGFTVTDRWGWFDRRPVEAYSSEYVVAAVRADRWRRAD